MDEKELAARAAELAQKETELAQKEQRLEQQEQNIIYKGTKERLYDKVKIPLWALDIMIGACVAGILLALVLGLVAR